MSTGTSIIGPIPLGQDPEEYDRRRRRVLWSMPTGLFVVGSRAGDRANLMVANLVMQVSTTPKLVAVAVEKAAVTAGLIGESRVFSISILARSDRAMVRRFVKPATEVEFGPGQNLTTIQGETVVEVTGGVPVLPAAVGWLACALRQTVELEAGPAEDGSHVLYIGEVVDVGELAGGGSGPEDGPGAGDVLRMEDTRMNYGG
ncbi:MAG TPA: flavin reductase family protein [Acidimicrobiales bacterium]|jgi:flavin reductase (DIM6/NTAB) family NADH-FMN oxidoreductase RutF